MSIIHDIEEYIRSGESFSQNLGLEIEHFVVDENGNQIDFHTISELIEEVGNDLGAELIYMDGYPVGYYNGEYSTSLEPACQFEISINPYDNLEEIKRIYEDFRRVWDPIFESIGYSFVVSTNLPIVESGVITPDSIPLSPKKRYKYMDEHFRESGRFGKYMMRASASAQVSVDYSSEEDMVKKLQVLEKISPILMIMMENKYNPDFTLPGAPDKKHLLRIQEWNDLDPVRTGFVPFSLDEDFGYKKMAEVVYNTPLILLTDGGRTIGVGNKSARDLFESGELNEYELDCEREKKLIEHFMSMGFFHYRVKQYIEIRVADSVPIEKALGYVALIKGLVYSDDNLDLLKEQLVSVKSIEEIQKAVEAIYRDGFDAVIYDGHTAAEWASELVELAAKNLSLDEQEYLKEFTRGTEENVRAFWSIG